MEPLVAVLSKEASPMLVMAKLVVEALVKRLLPESVVEAR